MKNWKGTKKKPFKVVEMENNKLAIANTEMYPTYAAHVYFNDEEGQANANLIAEAFNVVNECGLTHRQLAEQNKELLEALKEMNASFGYYDLELTDEDGMIAIKKTETAIKNAETI